MTVSQGRCSLHVRFSPTILHCFKSFLSHYRDAVTQQLNDGIRMLQMQAHMNNNEIHLCHTSCLLFDGGTLEDYLKKGELFLYPYVPYLADPISEQSRVGWMTTPKMVRTCLYKLNLVPLK